MPIERKLAAIMFTDIAGYTALSAKDSTKASELLKTQRDTLKPIVEKHGGLWMKEIGDGLLLTFDSATSAVECSIAIQEATKDIEDLNLRIGIHEGEVIKQDGDVIGDDVNVASRIEPFSAIGGVAISDKIYRAISSNQEFETKYIGKPKLKGVAQEVKVYCITSHGLPETDISKVSAKLEEESKFNIFALTGGILTAIGIAFWIAVGVFDVSFGGKTEVPSVGILMMENRGAEEDEFWASSITEDLIIKVAGAGLIRVAPMKEILEVDIKESFKEIAKQLRVKYLLTSSIYKKGNGFDLHCQLIEAESGNSKYANKWSESIDNAPTIVGNLADKIIQTLDVSTKQDISKQITTNAKAYEYYLRGKYHFNQRENIQDKVVAQDLIEKAIEIDNSLLVAHSFLGFIFSESGDYEKAMSIYQHTLDLTNEEEKNVKALTLYRMGHIYRYNRDYKSANSCYLNAIKIYEQLGNKNGIANALLNIGSIAADKKLPSIDIKNIENSNKEFSNSLSYYKSSLQYFKELDDRKGVAMSLRKIGLWYYREDSLEIARNNYFSPSLAILNELGEMGEIANGYHYVGMSYNIEHQDSINKAIEYLEKSLNLSKKLGDKLKIGVAQDDLGHVYHELGNFDLAQKYFNENYRLIIDEMDYPVGMIHTLRNLCTVNYYMGNYDKSKDYCSESLSLHLEKTDTLDNQEEKIIIINFLGQTHLQMQDVVTAYNYFSKSDSIQNILEYFWYLDDSELLRTKVLFLLTHKYLNKKHNINSVVSVITITDNISFDTYFHIYQLLGDTSYLETAYNQVQKKADNLEPDIAAKFLSYPIPKAIVEEWEKIK